MSLEKTVHNRCGSKCELCGSTDNLGIYEVPPNSNAEADECILICDTCREQIENPEKVDPHHWRCLNDSMWSQVPAVQVMAWRMLTRLKAEGWPQDLLDMLYLEEKMLTWAQATNDDSANKNSDEVKYVDCNGAALAAGDTITIIKDLDVKGTSFIAKRGTAVRNISLVSDNHEQIEGRVNGQQIVILTKFVKKAK